VPSCRRKLAAHFADEEDETVRKTMIEAQIFLSYRRDLNNLSIQESRLRRLYEKDEAELKRLIAERKEAEKGASGRGETPLGDRDHELSGGKALRAAVRSRRNWL
jgi:hypothetical protein